MNMTDLAGAVNAGATLYQMTKQSDDSRVQSKMAAINAALERLDLCISMCQTEIKSIESGIEVNLQEFYSNLDETLTSTRNLLAMVGKADLIKKVKFPSVGPKTDAKSQVPILKKIVGFFVDTKNSVAKGKVNEEIKYYNSPLNGLTSGLFSEELKQRQSMRVGVLALGLFAGYHGYKRNPPKSKSPSDLGHAAIGVGLWVLPSVLFGVAGGLGALGVAYLQGFGKSKNEQS
jgi:hypothetical protein